MNTMPKNTGIIAEAEAV